MTALLYHDEPLLTSFEATVVGHGTWGAEEQASILLDRTAFYPESGGQMADRGSLDAGGAAPFDVLDVQVDEAGVVHHVVAIGDRPPVGTRIRGQIDRARRRVHMALHTGQHMLSRALVDVAGAETVSSRLGETSCTIDAGVPALDERKLAEAEALVNAIVDDDVSVRAFFPSPDELASLPLRRAPKVKEHVRVVSIGDFDVSPCGGTHCLSTAQVGLVKVTGLERYKGMMRVSFAAGRRARDDLSARAAALGALSADLSCGALDVPAAVDKLRRDVAEARQALGRARARLADAAATELIDRASKQPGRPLVALLDDADLDGLRRVGARLTAVSDTIALLAAQTSDGVLVFAARGSASTFDCGAFVKRVTLAGGGRGGGKPDRAEGRLPAGADWVELCGRVLASDA